MDGPQTYNREIDDFTYPVKFPRRSFEYWCKMSRLHDPVPEFKYKGRRCVIKNFQLNECTRWARDDPNRSEASRQIYLDELAISVWFFEIKLKE